MTIAAAALALLLTVPAPLIAVHLAEWHFCPTYSPTTTDLPPT